MDTLCIVLSDAKLFMNYWTCYVICRGICENLVVAFWQTNLHNCTHFWLGSQPIVSHIFGSGSCHFWSFRELFIFFLQRAYKYSHEHVQRRAWLYQRQWKIVDNFNRCDLVKRDCATIHLVSFQCFHFDSREFALFEDRFEDFFLEMRIVKIQTRVKTLKKKNSPRSWRLKFSLQILAISSNLQR